VNSEDATTHGTAGSRPRTAVTIYALFIAAAWLLAWILKGDNEGLSSGILIGALLPSVLLALPIILRTTIENSVTASAILLGAGCINALLLYRLVRFFERRST
jgi:hypothetical protein